MVLGYELEFLEKFYLAEKFKLPMSLLQQEDVTGDKEIRSVQENRLITTNLIELSVEVDVMKWTEL